MTYKDIKYNEEVNELLKKGNQNLGLLGYTAAFFENSLLTFKGK